MEPSYLQHDHGQFPYLNAALLIQRKPTFLLVLSREWWNGATINNDGLDHSPIPSSVGPANDGQVGL